MYNISTQQFSGPFDLLLQLVEKKNLEITEISLAKITQDYLNYIGDQTLVHPEELADFLVVASTLLLIKSRSILPSLELNKEENEEIVDLEARLKIYKIYKEAAELIKKDFEKGNFSFSRLPWKDAEIRFSPPKNFSLDNLFNSFKKVFYETYFEAYFKERPLREQKIKKIISLEERIKELIEKLTGEKQYRFNDLVIDRSRRPDLVITFLAMLHLAKERIIAINQENNFGEIWISRQS